MDAPGRQPEASGQDRAFAAERRGSGSGVLRALALTATTIRLQPVEKTGERSRAYRVLVSGADLGAAGKTTFEGDGGRHADDADDISFGDPVNAALVVIDGVHALVWSRSTAKAD